MLPIFGPQVSEMFWTWAIQPIRCLLIQNEWNRFRGTFGPVVRGVSTREKYLDYLDEMKEGSLDFYATMRSLYRQKKKRYFRELESKDLLSMLPIEAYEDEELESDVKNIVTTMKDDVLKSNQKWPDIMESFHHQIILPLMNRVNLIE